MSETPKLKLTFFVDPAWRRKGLHTPLLYPFWGNPTGDESLFSKQMHDSYPYDTSCYGITGDITKADMVLPPYRHQWFLRYDKALFDECVRVAQKAGLPLLIDGTGDIEDPIDVENAYVLRIGGYRFLPEQSSIHIPPASDDLLERVLHGELQLRNKTNQKPVVGFAGWAQLTLQQKVRTFIKELPVRIRGIFDDRYLTMKKGVEWRAKALAILGNSPLVTLNLKVRSSFSGSAKTAGGDMRELREDLVDTVVNSDYALDVRGDANASSRLFEILSLGRIPVIVDTERNLPFSDMVRYQDFALIVDFRDIYQLPQKIAEHYASVSNEQFVAMQKAAREAFVQHFRIDAWMPHIIRELRDRRAIPNGS